MKIKELMFCGVLILIFSLCTGQQVFYNKTFEDELTNYCNYLDTVGYKKGFDFIYVDAHVNNDSVVFKIHLSCGSYELLEYEKSIIDFISFKGFDVLILGDFPNTVVPISHNQSLKVLDNIVKKRYPNEYAMIIKKNEIPAPVIYDYMSMKLVFLKGKLICSKRVYY
jgi:hypothetical protein